jgi:hypothetical protein
VLFADLEVFELLVGREDFVMSITLLYLITDPFREHFAYHPNGVISASRASNHVREDGNSG